MMSNHLVKGGIFGDADGQHATKAVRPQLESAGRMQDCETVDAASAMEASTRAARQALSHKACSVVFSYSRAVKEATRESGGRFVSMVRGAEFRKATTRTNSAMPN